jgi:hypothetical protein
MLHFRFESGIVHCGERHLRRKTKGVGVVVASPSTGMNNDNIEICQPMVELVELLSNQGFVIFEKRLQDFHFHEIYIQMSGGGSVDIEIEIQGVKKIKRNRFVCDCHWSTLETVEN